MKKETEKKYTFRPLHNYIVVKPISEKDLSAIEYRNSGIIITQTSEKRGKTVIADVVAVGPGKIETIQAPNGMYHGHVPMSLKETDRVAFSEYDSNEINIEGDQYFSIREEFVHYKLVDNIKTSGGTGGAGGETGGGGRAGPLRDALIQSK